MLNTLTLPLLTNRISYSIWIYFFFKFIIFIVLDFLNWYFLVSTGFDGLIKYVFFFLFLLFFFLLIYYFSSPLLFIYRIDSSF